MNKVNPISRRGRPLSHPEEDLRTPDEIAWWNKNIAEPLAKKRPPLPLAQPEDSRLAGPTKPSTCICRTKTPGVGADWDARPRPTRFD